MSVVDDAAMVAALFAVDPVGTGGVCLHSQVQPMRELWLELLHDLLPAAAPIKRIPCNISDGRLLGGLDLAATLKTNRPVAEQGVLAASDGGVVVVRMAERLSAHTAAALCAVMDGGEVVLMREAVSGRLPARLGVVAMDESIGDDEFVPRCLADRLAFLLDFDGLTARAALLPLHDAEQILAARALLPTVALDDELVERLCGTALALGVESLRLSVLASHVARVAAALDGRARVSEADAILAGRLVLAPRATVIPPNQSQSPAEPPPDRSQASAEPPASPPPSPAPAPPETGQQDRASPPEESRAEAPPPADSGPTDPPQPDVGELEDRVLEAAQAAIPPGLLAQLKAAASQGSSRSSAIGRAGSQQRGSGRGRPAGVRSGPPRGNARLNVLETLRAAAPWQRVRGRRLGADAEGQAATAQGVDDGAARLRIDPTDFRVTISKQRSQTLTIFAVDASGSAAMERLAEAKGAVELLLAECYIRRDQVAVVAFRGRVAELLLPPTRSLVRAKRSLAGMPGGGATPLATAIGVALKVAVQAQRRGETPTLVLLSDGRANIGRSGAPGREAAYADALAAATAVRASRIAALFVDTSPRPSALARSLAVAMNAQYLPLPFVNAKALSAAVQAAAGGR
jgi:magnesium chelatase subunit D